MEENSKLLIIIDDSEQIRFALRELLESSGYAVMTCANGRDGIAMLEDLAKKSIVPSAVVVDLVMDDVSGYEVIAAAKKLFPDSAVIAMSGGTPNLDPDLPLELAQMKGADACLRKPFGNGEFLLALSSAIRRS